MGVLRAFRAGIDRSRTREYFWKSRVILHAGSTDWQWVRLGGALQVDSDQKKARDRV
jgi:hypothetical protein